LSDGENLTQQLCDHLLKPTNNPPRTGLMAMVLVRGQVSAALAAIALTAKQQIADMPFAEDNRMVEALASDRAVLNVASIDAL
jgi:hypothetical protein